MIYVASSWSNVLHPAIVTMLRRCGNEVYDYRDGGFAWGSVDPRWEDWTPAQYAVAVWHPVARAAYERDVAALRACATCVLVLPSGRSASWELGYAMGQGKRAFVVQFEPARAELMYSEATLITTAGALFDVFGEPV